PSEGGAAACVVSAGDAGPPPAASAYPYVPDMGDGTYRNPIVLADYSDPDVIRAGNEFYLVASSFTNTPGLPILRSGDLVNWTLVGHALPNLPNARYSQYLVGAGVWAPALREHNGKFYVFFPTPDEGIFVVTAPNPAGPWSAPTLLLPGLGLIDPCPFWDDDGTAYVVHAYAKSRAGINNILHVRPMSPDATQILGPGQDVFGPDPVNYPTLEGPKLYKRNGWYYILAPAGGVTGGFEVALRSKSVYGPYEAMRVLEQGSTPVNGPHQGGMVDTPSGNEWWFVHFQDSGIYGRILHLQPVTWQNDWPLMGAPGANGLREPVLRHQKPDTCPQALAIPQTGDDFKGPALSPAWQWHANHGDSWYSLATVAGSLSLFPQPLPAAALGGPDGGTVAGLQPAPNLLLQKIPARSFDVDTVLQLTGTAGQSSAGVVLTGVGYPALSVTEVSSGVRVDLNSNGQTLATDMLPAGPVHLQVAFADGGQCRFSYGVDGSTLRVFAPLVQVQAVKGSWNGVSIGLFAVAPTGSTPPGRADFAYFNFSPYR
ncbi:MAG: glycoside hydrolase 43 family protein, partial [Myxococcota bacterium]|nr:glycoside hydrolase 43 family protein [Myxococcota bacterium]